MVNPHTPVAKKVADEVVFDVFKVEESSFFKSDLTDSPLIFDAHLLENTNLSPSSFHWNFQIEEKKTMFIHTN